MVKICAEKFGQFFSSQALAGFRILFFISFMMIISACKPTIETLPEESAEKQLPETTSSILNTAPNIPSALSCAATPLAGSTNNVCTLTAAAIVDPDGDTVSYSDDGSTCTDVSVSALTGNVTFTSPAKNVTCVIRVKVFDGLAYSDAISSATITGSNNAPTTPGSLACTTTPIAESTNNACTLTDALILDLDGDAVSYADGGSTCSTVLVDSTTGNAIFTAPARGATCLIKVKAFDGTSYSGIISSATITGANNAPNTPASITCPASPLAGSINNACTLSAAATPDVDGDTVSYFDDGSTCAAVVVTSATGSATFSAPAKGVSCLIKIKAFDGATYSSAVSSAAITGLNNIPATPTSLSCASTPLAGSTNNACTLTAAGTPDLDGDSVSYYDNASTCSATVVDSTSGAVTFTAPASGASCIIHVRAYDGVAYSNRVSSTINGSNNIPNTPSSLSCVTNPLAGSANNACTLTAASPADPDADTVSYVDDGSTCGSTVVNSSNGNATFTSPAKGVSCVVKVKAFDGSAYSNAIASATITGANNTPTAPSALTCATTPVAGSTNNACSLTAATPTDLDGDTVSYADGGSTCSTVVINGTTGDATFTAPASGATCLVKVKAFDGTTYSNAISATITGANNAPNTPDSLVCATAPLGGSANNVCTLTATSPVDPDGDSVTYSDGGSTCAAVVINSGSGNATFTAPAKGASCLVKVRAFDGSSYSSAISSATITGANNTPSTPSSLTCATTPLAGSTNNACTLSAAGTLDLDGDSVSYYNDGSTCSSVSVSVVTGDATFTAPAKGATCLVKVKAYDGTTYSSAVSSATITGANNAPNIPASLTCTTSPIAGSAGNTCTLSATSPADPDGDSVTYADGGSTCSTVVVNSGTGNATFTAPAQAATCLVKVKAYDGSTYGNAVSSSTITGASSIPGVFSISDAAPGNSQVVLTWGASTGVTSYTVKYGTATGNYPTTFSTSATSPSTITGLTNGVTYYFMVTAVNGSGNRNASAEVVAAPSAGEAFSCPSNYIPVSPNAAVGTYSDFCVAKYNMKAVDAATNGDLLGAGNGQGMNVWTTNGCWIETSGECDTGGNPDQQSCENDGGNWTSYGYFTDCNILTRYNSAGVPVYPASRPDGTPWVNINPTEAKAACTSLGSSYDLISNPEWMTIARSIESVSSNWSSGIIGTGMIPRGHSDGSDGALSVTNTADPYNGTGNNSGQAVGSGWEQKRTHTLSTGALIWDFSGNVDQWVDWALTAGLQLGPTTCGGWTELPSVVCGALPATSYLPANATYNSTKGVGKFYGGNGGAARRGGNSSHGNLAGAFTLDLGFSLATTSPIIGFRCVYRPDVSAGALPYTANWTAGNDGWSISSAGWRINNGGQNNLGQIAFDYTGGYIVVSKTVNFATASKMRFYASGGGFSMSMTVKIGGVVVGSTTPSGWVQYGPYDIPAGPVLIEFITDTDDIMEDTLYLSSLTFTTN